MASIKKSFPTTILSFSYARHKAGRLGAFTEILSQDITEITDFDNLHKPEGILLQSQKDVQNYLVQKKVFF